MNIDNLFFETEGNNGNNGNSRELSGTAQLTSVAAGVATEILRQVTADSDQYNDNDLFKNSRSNADSMDAFIDSFDCAATIDVEFLKDIKEEILLNMLKSQQSKRSRCKSKTMTLDNYKSMMTAAIAERMLRDVLGKPKGAGSIRNTSGSVEYTIAQLEELAEDQNKLRAAIRNVQSKKSIMKSKAGFDESSERWQSLLKVEQQLKDLRTGSQPQVVEIDTTKNELEALLGDTDLEHLKAVDSKELLSKIAGLIGKM